jgi:L-lactate dehydrogenase
MKIGIVGSGFVGATAGYALVMQGVGREIVTRPWGYSARVSDLLHCVMVKQERVATR